MSGGEQQAWAAPGATVLLAASDQYRAGFSAITARARRHFERHDWAAAQRDATRRLDVYGESVSEALRHLSTRLGALATDRGAWNAMRAGYAAAIAGRGDAELAETFFNSCARRAFQTVGVDPEVEFVAIAVREPEGRIAPGLVDNVPARGPARRAGAHPARAAPAAGAVGRPRGRRAARRRRHRATRPPDAVNGKAVFAKKCVFCHGSDGQGTMAGPPLWGPDSYNIAARMARVSVAASFIKANMPRGWGWTVTDDEAFDVAAFINSQPRPDFPAKVYDWPKGGKPADAPY